MVLFFLKHTQIIKDPINMRCFFSVAVLNNTSKILIK